MFFYLKRWNFQQMCQVLYSQNTCKILRIKAFKNSWISNIMVLLCSTWWLQTYLLFKLNDVIQGCVGLIQPKVKQQAFRQRDSQNMGDYRLHRYVIGKPKPAARNDQLIVSAKTSRSVGKPPVYRSGFYASKRDSSFVRRPSIWCLPRKLDERHVFLRSGLIITFFQSFWSNVQFKNNFFGNLKVIAIIFYCKHCCSSSQKK